VISMPLYDYHCKRCNYTFESYAKIEQRYDVNCERCGGEVVIHYSPGKQKVKIFPAGVWEHIAPEPLEITSARQLREACKKYGCYAKYLDF